MRLGHANRVWQVAHQLRVHGVWGGDMDFEDQMDVVPCLEGFRTRRFA